MTDDAAPIQPTVLRDGREAPRKQVWSWVLWDWANQPFNTVILTFIFTALYLTSDAFIDPAVVALGEDDPTYLAARAGLDSGFGFAVFIAGLAIALLAPALGHRTDAAGTRKRWLAITTAGTVVLVAALFFVEADPVFFVLGAALVATASAVNEIAASQYYAMLVQVSTPKTIGRTSGLGWGAGYIGGIVALVIVVVAYAFDWFGLAQEDGLPFRLVAVGCAIWIAAFSIPIFLNVPESTPPPGSKPVGFFASYVEVFRSVRNLWRTERQTFWFLAASAVYRDGLAGVFAFGAIIAAGTFGFEFLEVVIFGIAANLVAGVSTIISGRFDDRFGPRAVILTALVGLVVAGMGVFFLRDLGDIVFWIGGLLLCCFVGPAQSASRSLLARLAPAGHEGEIFGLYATTGRAASFLSPGLWALFIALSGTQAWGILGIVLVIAVGLVLMLFVKAGARTSV